MEVADQKRMRKPGWTESGTGPVSRKLCALPRAPGSPTFQWGLSKPLVNVGVTSGATQVTQKWGNWITNQTGYAYLLLCAQLLSCIQFFVPLWTAAPQAPLGILQARILKWVAIFSSRGSSPPRDWIQVSYIAGRFFFFFFVFFLPSEPPGKPLRTLKNNLSVHQWNFDRVFMHDNRHRL